VFSGIVVETGVVRSAEPAAAGLTLAIAAAGVAATARVGDSVAVAGCCLTVTACDGDVVRFDAVAETLRRSTLGDLQAGDAVNLEPALRVGDRLGGHWVQGHVDAVGEVVAVRSEGEATNVRFSAPEAVLRYTIEKGSVCVDGVGLTVTEVDGDGFSVTLIPHTLAVTTLGSVAAGRRVNLEADLIGKYVEKLANRG
jgi:riboflavin synthase